MEFVEFAAFTKSLRTRITPDEYQALQNVLIERPDFGPLIPDGGGLRKMRVRAAGRGKRGGARVIYYWFVEDHQIHFLDIYAKNEKSDLTKAQLKELRGILEALKELQVVRITSQQPRRQ